MKVLVVDDDPMTLAAISNCLQVPGIDVVTAGNGLDAINIVQESKLDLIISDVMMPGMSGLSLLSLLKQFYLDRIPVIIISSLDKADIVMSSLGLGADDFIPKPINYENLLTRVKLYQK